ncbi:MAG: ATP-dependent helicase HrpB [Planctomycetes bacterium]|nr:ATP-dependent helicase HrpB [Planctomycetota bacterium]
MNERVERLPIDEHLDAIRARLVRDGALVLVAEPGAGKTTRVPPALVDGGVAGSDRGAGQVVVLEPRRVAARAAARRVSEERGTELGGFAGYSVRFDSRTSRATRVRFVTEGLLVRELQHDPELARASVVVLDEFHERSIHADLALALVAEVRRSLRPDLKIVVMSATLDAEPIAAFLGAEVVRVPGRLHPLAIEQVERFDDRPLFVRVTDGVKRMLDATDGDVLAFLPGVGEIRRAEAELASLRNVLVLPLFGDQRPEEQDRIFAPSDCRKVVLATNVAETSLTVPGVTAVVDSGVARILAHDPDVGLDRLELKPISRASATQRAGRAGRIAPGRVLQLWTRADASKMRERELPEIARVDLAPTVLELAVWGVRDPRTFGWFERPDDAALERASELLVRLGALDPGTHAPTAIGRAMAELPCAPRLARMLVAAAELGCIAEGALFAALLSERDLFASRRREKHRSVGPSDLFARRDAWLHRDGDLDRNLVRAIERSADDLARATQRLFPGSRDRDASDDELLRVVFAGFVDRVARRRATKPDEALMVGGRGLVFGPESVVRDDELFVVLDADLGRRGQANATIRQASAIRREWLVEVAGGALHESRETRFDDVKGRAYGVRRVVYEDLALEESETGAPEPAAATRALLEFAREHPERVLDLQGDGGQLLARLRSLREWLPELGLSPHDTADVLAALEPWCDGKTSVEELRRVPLGDVLRSRLTREQARSLDEHAPEALDLPSGTRRRLEYEPGKPPVLAVRLQELFGLADTPTVARGRVKVLLHLLAPNQRVVQVTQDLSSFWNTTYQQVRKDLRARYPKHSWPEDPWTATPTSRTVRRRRT